jgi:hypothetical protein
VPVSQPLFYTSGLPAIQAGLDLACIYLMVGTMEILSVGCVRSFKPFEIERINV